MGDDGQNGQDVPNVPKQDQNQGQGVLSAALGEQEQDEIQGLRHALVQMRLRTEEDVSRMNDWEVLHCFDQTMLETAVSPPLSSPPLDTHAPAPAPATHASAHMRSFRDIDQPTPMPSMSTPALVMQQHNNNVQRTLSQQLEIADVDLHTMTATVAQWIVHVRGYDALERFLASASPWFGEADVAFFRKHRIDLEAQIHRMQAQIRVRVLETRQRVLFQFLERHEPFLSQAVFQSWVALNGALWEKAPAAHSSESPQHPRDGRDDPRDGWDADDDTTTDVTGAPAHAQKKRERGRDPTAHTEENQYANAYADRQVDSDDEDD